MFVATTLGLSPSHGEKEKLPAFLLSPSVVKAGDTSSILNMIPFNENKRKFFPFSLFNQPCF